MTHATHRQTYVSLLMRHPLMDARVKPGHDRIASNLENYAFALGRAETAACQRFTLLRLSGITMRDGFMKS